MKPSDRQPESPPLDQPAERANTSECVRTETGLLKGLPMPTPRHQRPRNGSSVRPTDPKPQTKKPVPPSKAAPLPVIDLQWRSLSFRAWAAVIKVLPEVTKLVRELRGLAQVLSPVLVGLLLVMLVNQLVPDFYARSEPASKNRGIGALPPSKSREARREGAERQTKRAARISRRTLSGLSDTRPGIMR